MGIHSVEKKQLSAKGMLAKVRSIFSQIPESQKDTRGLKSKIPLTDCLMSGLAVFGLKFPSLLQGRVTYYHQMLAGVLVHPDHKEAIPFCPEPISKADGSTKNVFGVFYRSSTATLL
jgi:hypothetical protein